MQIAVKNTDEGYELTIGNTTISGLTNEDIRDLDYKLNLTWYKGDVENYISEKEIQLSEEAFDEVLHCYADLRQDNDGDEYGMTWDECLKEAFEICGYKYGDTLTPKMKEILIGKIAEESNETIADIIGYDAKDLSFLDKEDVLTHITEYVENLESTSDGEKELIELYEEFV